jgi:hypothetical protein
LWWQTRRDWCLQLIVCATWSWSFQIYFCITSVDLQLDAQNYYLFTYNTFIKILYMFRALPWSSSGSLRRNCIYAASGIVTLCRWLSCAPVKKELHVSTLLFMTHTQSTLFIFLAREISIILIQNPTVTLWKEE